MPHYFAYGNLLDIELMRRIAPSAKAVAVARLEGQEIAFGRCNDPAIGGCTLAPRPGAETWGVQYELSEEDMATLDKAAGVDKGHWRHEPVTLKTADGEEIASVTYLIPEVSGHYAPPDTYVAPIYKGAEALGLPESYRARLRDLIVEAQGKAG